MEMLPVVARGKEARFGIRRKKLDTSAVLLSVCTSSTKLAEDKG
jgi:hypothetical protein